MNRIDTLDNTFNFMGRMIQEPWATILSLALVIVCGMIALTIIMFITRRLLKKSSHMDDMLNSFVVNLIKVAGIIIIIAIIVIYIIDKRRKDK